MSSNSREDIYSVDLNGIDACEAGTVPSSSASNFEGLTTNYGAFYRGHMELGVQPAVANSALVPG